MWKPYLSFLETSWALLSPSLKPSLKLPLSPFYSSYVPTSHWCNGRRDAIDDATPSTQRRRRRHRLLRISHHQPPSTPSSSQTSLTLANWRHEVDTTTKKTYNLFDKKEIRETKAKRWRSSSISRWLSLAGWLAPWEPPFLYSTGPSLRIIFYNFWRINLYIPNMI